MSHLSRKPHWVGTGGVWDALRNSPRIVQREFKAGKALREARYVSPTTPDASALRRLDILKFFKKVEIPPRRDGGKVTRDEIYSDFGHGVRWGRRDMVQAASNKHQEVIWWLYRNTRAPRAMKSVLMVAVYNGDIVLLEWFRAKYRTQGLDPDSEDEDYEVGEEKL
ncbi:hypothetical protein Pcac1_g4376 [Phytophthora cactorum]|uniref:Uncharacterized protein n=1 Tax=Phytophthora cactorum TaxID=29920 RepID=A0A8T1F5A8_9STRA|nr:hypothetical protein Pcac1_g4376 [Phytophthora cactorum]KAG2804989.1 hypothetical protein PC112_g18469 [Phytophthora cactorum]KAG2967886.1 hypothetical protein PC118_g18337 [Phytophthora cactorum]KAG3198601.1 hypothetical protein PC128_g5904 [Phytophthora cactorum]KAG4059161.1 hypothetical protein PC123_g5898 [Phytophthora cactorum]